MNKQFSDLFDKAVKEQCLADKTKLELVDNTHLILGRFAELIVKECLAVQKKCPHHIAPAKFVRDYFGVE